MKSDRYLQGLANVSGEVQTINMSIVFIHVSASALPLQCEAATDNMPTDDGCVPGKLHLQKEVAGRIWPKGHHSNPLVQLTSLRKDTLHVQYEITSNRTGSCRIYVTTLRHHKMLEEIDLNTISSKCDVFIAYHYIIHMYFFIKYFGIYRLHKDLSFLASNFLNN